MKKNNGTSTQNKTSRIIVITILIICLVGFGLFLIIRTQETTMVDSREPEATVLTSPQNPLNVQVVVTTTSEAVVSTRAVNIEESKDLDAEVQELYEGEMNLSYYVVITEQR